MTLRFVGDLSALRQWVSLALSRAIVALPFLTATVGLLVAVNPRLGLTVGAVIAGGAMASLKLSRPMRGASREARRRRSRLAANLTEQVAAIGVVQVCGQRDRERRRRSQQSRHLRDAMVGRAQRIGRLRGLTEATAVLALAAALVIGAGEVGGGRASPGTVVAAMALVGLLVAPLRDLGCAQEHWHASRVALERLQDFLATPGAAAASAGDPG